MRFSKNGIKQINTALIYATLILVASHFTAGSDQSDSITMYIIAVWFVHSSYLDSRARRCAVKSKQD